MTNDWQVYKMGELLTQNFNGVRVLPENSYKLLGVRLEGRGAYLREEKSGGIISANILNPVHAGDFIYSRLFAWRGAFGVVPEELDGCFVSGEFPTFVINKEKLLPKFLQLFFARSIIWEEVEKYCTGTTKASRNRFKEKFFLGFEILLPPLGKQHLIVEHIEALSDRIVRAKSLREDINQETDLLFSRTLSEAYDEALLIAGNSERLEELCTVITDGTHVTPSYVDEGIPFLSVKDISSGEIDFSRTRFISPEEHAFLTKRSKPERHDILLTKVGTTGIAKVVDVDREFSIFVSIALLKLDKTRLDSKFTEYMLNSPILKQHSSDGTRGVGNKNLVLKFIKEFPMPAPPLDEQRRIVAYLDSVQARLASLRELQSATEEELSALLPSVLDRAFKGKL